MQTADAIYPSLKERTVIVTGGATGIGASVVEHFAAQGSRVAFLDLDAEGAAATLERIARRGLAPPLFRHCDLRDIDRLQAEMRAIAGQLGDAAVLVNNAARDDRHTVEEITPAQWDEKIAVNLKHQFFAAQAVIEGMKRIGGGSIVNFGSISWRMKSERLPVYETAKAAVEGMTRGMARELGPYNIRVNCVVPGWVMTDRQLKLWVTPESEAAMLRGQCLKTRLMPDDLARMVLWLGAQDSRMATAQMFVVDAGWS